MNDLLTLARADAGRKLKSEPIALVPVVKDVCRQAQVLDPERKIVLDCTLESLQPVAGDGTAGLAALGDRDALKQVLLNLMMNAVKFTRAGGRVALDARSDRLGRLILRVSDNGVGIDPEHLSQVLQPFSQADSSLGRKYEGSGLGLALAHKLVKLHGAELYIDSEVGAGTTVTIIFPKDRVLRRVCPSRVA